MEAAGVFLIAVFVLVVLPAVGLLALARWFARKTTRAVRIARVTMVLTGVLLGVAVAVTWAYSGHPEYDRECHEWIGTPPLLQALLAAPIFEAAVGLVFMALARCCITSSDS